MLELAYGSHPGRHRGLAQQLDRQASRVDPMDSGR